MTITTTNVVGAIALPNDTIAAKTEVLFAMTGFDTAAAESATIFPQAVVATLDAGGNLDVDLWSNVDGARGTFYGVSIRSYYDDHPTKVAFSVDCGKIEVPTSGGPYDLNDLLPIAPPDGVTVDEYLATLQASAAAAEAAATSASADATAAGVSETNAAASAAEAALYDGPRLDDVAALAADTALTYTADQPGTVVVGGYVNTRAEGFSYKVASLVATDHHLTTAGGVKLYYASGIGQATSRTDLKALPTYLSSAQLTEPGREAIAVWDAAIPIADHQADPNERIYVAPNAAAVGAWVLQPEGGVLSTETAGGASSVGLPSEPQKPTGARTSRISTTIKAPAAARAIMPIWPWLPDASAAVNGQQGLIMPHSGSPIPVAQSGGSWYNLTSGAAVTNDFVPEGATFVFDKANGQYYFAGASKVIGDFTAVTVGGKSRHRLDGDDCGIIASQEYTVLVEYTTPEAPGFSGTPHLFSMTDPAVSNNRTEVWLSATTAVAGEHSVYHGRPSGAAGQYATPFNWGSTGSQRPVGYGRSRMVFSSKAGAAITCGRDGYPVVSTGTSVAGTISVDRIALGYRALNALEDQPLLSDAIYDSLRIVIWPYAMSAEEIERALEHSEAGLRPWMIIGDSNNFDPGVNDATDPTGYGIASKLKALTVTDGYRCVGTDWTGGIAWYRESVAAANDNMLTKLRAKPDRVKAWDFIFTDSQADENAAGNVCGIDEAVSWFRHSRWVTMQSFYGLNRRPTDTAEREAYDLLRSEMALRIASEHLIDPMPALLAASTGSGQDLIDVADGVIPTSLTKDDIHINHTTGVAAYAGAIKAAIENNGVIVGGQWA